MNIKIGENDLIKGSLYLKLIADYKVYDAKQKAQVECLQEEVEILTAQLEGLVASLDAKERVKKHIRTLNAKIVNQKKEINAMKVVQRQLQRDKDFLISKLCQKEREEKASTPSLKNR